MDHVKCAAATRPTSTSVASTSAPTGRLYGGQSSESSSLLSAAATAASTKNSSTQVKSRHSMIHPVPNQPPQTPHNPTNPAPAGSAPPEAYHPAAAQPGIPNMAGYPQLDYSMMMVPMNGPRPAGGPDQTAGLSTMAVGATPFIPHASQYQHVVPPNQAQYVVTSSAAGGVQAPPPGGYVTYGHHAAPQGTPTGAQMAAPPPNAAYGYPAAPAGQHPPPGAPSFVPTSYPTDAMGAPMVMMQHMAPPPTAHQHQPPPHSAGMPHALLPQPPQPVVAGTAPTYVGGPPPAQPASLPPASPAAAVTPQQPVPAGVSADEQTVPAAPTTTTSNPMNLPMEKLKQLLQHQLEYYFSRENLAHDAYLISQMDSDQFVPIATIANFNQIKKLTLDVALVTGVLRGTYYLPFVANCSFIIHVRYSKN